MDSSRANVSSIRMHYIFWPQHHSHLFVFSGQYSDSLEIKWILVFVLEFKDFGCQTVLMKCPQIVIKMVLQKLWSIVIISCWSWNLCHRFERIKLIKRAFLQWNNFYTFVLKYMILVVNFKNSASCTKKSCKIIFFRHLSSEIQFAFVPRIDFVLFDFTLTMITDW